MCLKNPYLLEWFCLHQPGRGLRLPLGPSGPSCSGDCPHEGGLKRNGQVWTLERRQVFRLFLQGEAGVVQGKLSLFFLLLVSPSVSNQLLIYRSPVLPEKDSVLIPTTANDDAGWQAYLLGMRWGVCRVAERLLNTGSMEKPVSPPTESRQCL